MTEVPAQQHVGLGKNGQGDLGGIIPTFGRDHAGLQIGLGQCNGLGCDGDARYVLTNWGVSEPLEATGRGLMNKGFRVEINERPGAAIVTYRKLDAQQ